MHFLLMRNIFEDQSDHKIKRSMMKMCIGIKSLTRAEAKRERRVLKGDKGFASSGCNLKSIAATLKNANLL